MCVWSHVYVRKADFPNWSIILLQEDLRSTWNVHACAHMWWQISFLARKFGISENPEYAVHIWARDLLENFFQYSSFSLRNWSSTSLKGCPAAVKLLLGWIGVQLCWALAASFLLFFSFLLSYTKHWCGRATPAAKLLRFSHSFEPRSTTYDCMLKHLERSERCVSIHVHSSLHSEFTRNDSTFNNISSRAASLSHSNTFA